MYLSYFGLAEAPFSIAPDPRYLYLTKSHQEALAHLLYGVSGDGGFVLLTGEVGAGKTTVCRCLLEQMPEACDVAYIFNPRLTVEELLSTICTELRIGYPEGNTSVKVFVDCINAYLLDANARGRHTVLIIDEAQNLSADVLEQMRLLTNLETNQRKLLQIILLGQPELAQMLAKPELRQLAQRIVARYHLGPLTRQEVAPYVRHRLEVSGTQRDLFPESLMGQLHRLSNGVPRIINVLCDRALLGAYAQSKDRVDRTTLAKAAREVFGEPQARGRSVSRAGAFALLLVTGAIAFGAYQWVQRHGEATPPETAKTSPATEAGSTKAISSADKAPAEEPAQAFALPAGMPPAKSRSLAYAALFEAWGVAFEGGDACAHAQSNGLRCRTARGALDDLREINRPAVMRLRDEEDRDIYATLTQLDDKHATLSVGADTRSVTLATLATQWSGHYTVLWRVPAEARENLQPGEQGPAVTWLSAQLRRAQGEPPQTDEDAVFDEALVRRLKQFQFAHGLVPDGVLGPQTLMRLSGIADPSAPTLVRKPGKS